MKPLVSVHNLKLLALLGCLLAGPVLATSNGAYLPSSPRGQGGQDSIETGSGTRCSQSMNSGKGYFDVGVVGATGSGVEDDASVNLNSHNNEGLVYLRVTIPIGKPPKRIDCSRVYELELQRLRTELEYFKMGID